MAKGGYVFNFSVLSPTVTFSYLLVIGGEEQREINKDMTDLLLTLF